MITPFSTLRRMYSDDLHKMMEHRNKELEIWSRSRGRHNFSRAYNVPIYSGTPGKTVLRDAYPNPIQTYMELQIKPGFYFLEFVH